MVAGRRRGAWGRGMIGDEREHKEAAWSSFVVMKQTYTGNFIVYFLEGHIRDW